MLVGTCGLGGCDARFRPGSATLADPFSEYDNLITEVRQFFFAGETSSMAFFYCEGELGRHPLGLWPVILHTFIFSMLFLLKRPIIHAVNHIPKVDPDGDGALNTSNVVNEYRL